MKFKPGQKVKAFIECELVGYIEDMDCFVAMDSDGEQLLVKTKYLMLDHSKMREAA